MKRSENATREACFAEKAGYFDQKIFFLEAQRTPKCPNFIRVLKNEGRKLRQV